MSSAQGQTYRPPDTLPSFLRASIECAPSATSIDAAYLIPSISPSPQSIQDSSNDTGGQEEETGNGSSDSSIPESDVASTASLWETVRMSNSSVGSSLPRITTRSESGKRDTDQKTTSMQRPASASGLKAKSVKALAPYDLGFRKNVLDPRGITINAQTKSMKAEANFGGDKAHGGRAKYYTEKATASRLWLEVSDEYLQEVINEYECMNTEHALETEYAAYALDSFLKNELRIRNVMRRTKDRAWRLERTLALVAKPSVDNPVWLPPPVVVRKNANNNLLTEYTFDLRPDCAYWISLQGFSAEYKYQVKEHALVVNDKRTCTYLTIEFKKDDERETAAENQVAATGSTSLYNRYLLRDRSLETAQQPWTEDLANQLVHYGITFTGSDYKIWALRPKVDDKWRWKGCEMQRMFTGTCVSEDGVTDLFDWLNEIHCWALTVHGPECENDIKRAMSAMAPITKFRVSDMHELVPKGSASVDEGSDEDGALVREEGGKEGEGVLTEETGGEEEVVSSEA